MNPTSSSISDAGLDTLPRRIRILAVILAAQALLLWGVTLEERIPAPPALDQIAANFASWNLIGEEELDGATEALLKPDASLVRGYRHAGNQTAATLFVGYFKTSQPNHPMPHSPAVCLPGAGWKEVYQHEISLTGAHGEAFPLNEYVLEKAGQRLIVLYWYQNRQRSWANAVLAKVYMLPDFFRYRRSDVALVRISLSAKDSSSRQQLEIAKDFARLVYPAVREVIPPSSAP